MLKRIWTKPLAIAALLMIAGADADRCAYSQQPAASGALEGRLTDRRSAPLEKMTVTLRSAITGAQVQTVTARGGRYRFAGLPNGEYSLTATGPAGTGAVDGIYIAAGHEAHVQIAIDLAPPAAALNLGDAPSPQRLPTQSSKVPSKPMN